MYVLDLDILESSMNVIQRCLLSVDINFWGREWGNSIWIFDLETSHCLYTACCYRWCIFWWTGCIEGRSRKTVTPVTSSLNRIFSEACSLWTYVNERKTFSLFSPEYCKYSLGIHTYILHSKFCEACLLRTKVIEWKSFFGPSDLDLERRNPKCNQRLRLYTWILYSK